MQCLMWQKWNSNLFHILTCTYFLKKVWGVEFLLFLIDIVRPAKSIWNLLTQSKNQKHMYLDASNLYGYAVSKFLPTSGFKCIDPKEVDLNKYTSNISKGCVLEVDLEYPNLN